MGRPLQLVAVRGALVTMQLEKIMKTSFELSAEFRETQGKGGSRPCVTRAKCRQYCMADIRTRAH